MTQPELVAPALAHQAEPPPGADGAERRAEEAEHAIVAERAARRAAEISAERFQFLSEASALLAASLDEDAVVANLAHLGVAMLADWCAVYLVDPGGFVRLTSVASDPPSAGDATAGEPTTGAQADLATRVYGGARSILEPLGDRQIANRARLGVPLIAQGRCLGAVVFLTAVIPDRLRASGDVVLAEELARHAASALANARLYAELAERRAQERRSAHEQRRLQESLRLSETMSAIGAVAAGVAHEVRNPLFGLSSTLDALQSSFPEHRELEPFIGTLRQQTERLGKLMSDLLEYGKPSLDERTVVPLGDVLARAIAHCEPVAALAAVRVQPEFDRHALPSLPMDRDRFTRAVQNLVENAIQHSSRDGLVRVAAALVDGEEGRWVECRVIDHGGGIAPRDLPRLFEPFFTKRHGGTGLGLSIVEKIVREHGGTVAAANGPHGGAVLTMRIPLGRAPETLR